MISISGVPWRVLGFIVWDYRLRVSEGKGRLMVWFRGCLEERSNSALPRDIFSIRRGRARGFQLRALIIKGQFSFLGIFWEIAILDV